MPVDLVFTTRYGDPIESRNFNRYLASRCTAAGLRQITIHDARHTCATLLVDLDVHPRIVMQILRHVHPIRLRGHERTHQSRPSPCDRCHL